MLQKLTKYINKDLVLVYQYGKVGSTTISHSVPNSINVHDLYGTVMCPPGFKYRHGLFYRKIYFPIDRLVRRTLIRRNKKIKIIVPVRDPVDRNVSMFFQDLPFYYVDYFAKHKGYAKSEGNDLLKDVFIKSFNHQSPDEWFSREFSRFTGISVDEIEFDSNSFYCCVEKGKYSCLIIKSESIKSLLGKKVIEDFVKKDVVWRDVNRGGMKWYKDVYAAFVSDDEFIAEYRKLVSRLVVASRFFLINK